MKKNKLIIIGFFILFAIIVFIIYTRFMEIKLYDNGDFKKIYNNYENVYESNILGEKINKIDDNTIRQVLETIKDEKIRPIHFWEYDSLKNGDSYKFIVVIKNKEYIFNITQNTVVIEKNIYRTKNNLYEIVSKVF